MLGGFIESALFEVGGGGMMPPPSPETLIVVQIGWQKIPADAARSCAPLRLQGKSAEAPQTWDFA